MRVQRSSGFRPRTDAFRHHIAPIAGVISSFGIHHTQYADDTLFYIYIYGTSTENLGKIQRVINTLARVFLGARKRDHITPVLADLHWLPIASRIRFKVALQTYKTVTTKKPEYLADHISFQTASRSLRSSSTNRLNVDVGRTSFASHAFRHAAPSVWNALPVPLTDFHNL